MTAREQREAHCLSRFGKLAVFYLLLTGLFIQGSAALTSYSRQELWDIGLHNFNCFIVDLQLYPQDLLNNEGCPLFPAGRKC